MNESCKKCGFHQGHYSECPMQEQITIDDLSMENSLIRARNERLEAEKVELVEALHRVSWFLTIMLDKGDEPNCLPHARQLVEKHTGSAT